MFLVLLDTDHIKKYVFGSPRLMEIRGASALLDDLNRNRIKELVAVNMGELIYAGGGTALAQVDSEEKAQAIISGAEKIFGEVTTVASVTGVFMKVEEGSSKNGFKETLTKLHQNLHDVKVSKKGYSGALSGGLVRFCESCGSYPAEFIPGYPRNEELLCRSCQIKRKYSAEISSRKQLSGFMKEFQQYLKCDGEYIVERQPQTLEDIGLVSRGNNKIALIYCDGNRMGLRVRNLDNPSSYAAFSKGVDGAIRRATYETLAEELPPRRMPDGNREVFPFEIMMIGGDDLVLITVADKAIDVACKISDRFSQYVMESVGMGLTISTGLVWAQNHYPIYMMLESAEQLLGSAKRAVHTGSEGEYASIDFMDLAGSQSGDLDEYRQNVFHMTSDDQRENYCLTQRPYTFAELKQYLDLIRELKKINFPKSKLELLYNSVFVGKNQACYDTMLMVAKSQPETKETLKRLFELTGATNLPPWKVEHGEETTYTCNLPDLIELYPYVF